MSLWQHAGSGKVLINASNKIIECASCPCELCAKSTDTVDVTIAGTIWNGNSGGLGYTILTLNINGTFNFTYHSEISPGVFKWVPTSDYTVGTRTGGSGLIKVSDGGGCELFCSAGLYYMINFFTPDFGSSSPATPQLAGTPIDNDFQTDTSAPGNYNVYAGNATVNVS